jgi:hypothetical protein
MKEILRSNLCVFILFGFNYIEKCLLSLMSKKYGMLLIFGEIISHKYKRLLVKNYGKSRSKPINKKYLLTGIFWVFMKINWGILG